MHGKRDIDNALGDIEKYAIEDSLSLISILLTAVDFSAANML